MVSIEFNWVGLSWLWIEVDVNLTEVAGVVDDVVAVAAAVVLVVDVASAAALANVISVLVEFVGLDVDVGSLTEEVFNHPFLIPMVIHHGFVPWCGRDDFYSSEYDIAYFGDVIE